MSTKGALKGHSSLVFAISEQKQVHETMLRLILGRVNASAALCRWAQREDNEAIKKVTEKLHESQVQLSNIQKEAAEKLVQVRKALEDILQVELGIDAIKSEFDEGVVKIERLRKQLSSVRRKSDLAKLASVEEELRQCIDFQGELTEELKVKTLKAELFKNTKFKDAMIALHKTSMETFTDLTRYNTTALEILEKMPDVPGHVALERPETKQATAGKDSIVIAELGKELDARIRRPLEINGEGKDDSHSRHCETLPRSSPLSSPTEEFHFRNPVKRSESAKIAVPFERPKNFRFDPTTQMSFKNRRLPVEPPQDFQNVPPANMKKIPLMSVKKRSASPKTSLRRKDGHKRKGILGPHLSGDQASSDEFEEPGYVCPNEVSKTSSFPHGSYIRRRRASTGTLPDNAQDGYSEPVDSCKPAHVPGNQGNYIEPYDARTNMFPTSVQNEVVWNTSPIHRVEQSDENDYIYDVIEDTGDKSSGDDYVYDVIIPDPNENPPEKKGSPQNAITFTPTDFHMAAGLSVKVNVNLMGSEIPPELPPRKIPSKPLQSPAQPIPSNKLKRVGSEPSDMHILSYSPSGIEMSQSVQDIQFGMSPIKDVPPKPPRKPRSVGSIKDADEKPPKLPPRRGEVVELTTSDEENEEENSIYEPASVNVKNMIAFLQEKSVEMPHLVNPMQAKKPSS